MFGTITTNPKALTPEEKARYGAVYCGLCHQLDAAYGSAGCAVLAYDMAFLGMLLGSLYNLGETNGSRRCVPHPVKPHPYVLTEATAYAADMNLLLAYYQRLDDWQDDKNPVARGQAQALERYLPALQSRWPRQCGAVTARMAELAKMEKENELNPDLPANCFGELLAEVFLWRQDEYSRPLGQMAAALGRFVYLLDAVNDLKADIKKQRYNPLVAQLNTDFTPVLTLLMAECTDAFGQLPIHRDAHILQNVLYSGVWQNLRRQNTQQTEGAED